MVSGLLLLALWVMVCADAFSSSGRKPSGAAARIPLGLSKDSATYAEPQQMRILRAMNSPRLDSDYCCCLCAPNATEVWRYVPADEPDCDEALCREEVDECAEVVRWVGATGDGGSSPAPAQILARCRFQFRKLQRVLSTFEQRVLQAARDNREQTATALRSFGMAP